MSADDMYNTQNWTWGTLASQIEPAKTQKRKNTLYALAFLWIWSGLYYQYNKEESPQVIPIVPAPKPPEIPSWWLDFNYISTKEIEDSVMTNERKLVQKRIQESKVDTLNITTSYSDSEKNWQLPKVKQIKIPIKELEELKKNIKYKATRTMTDDWRKWYIKHTKIWMNILKKVASWLWIDKIKDQNEKLKAISLFIQSRYLHNEMWYKHDLVNTRTWIDTVDYIRNPALSIIDWIKSWYQWDCDDFASNFISLSIASWIPESDLYMIFTKTHAFVGIKWYTWKTEGRYYYLNPKGEKIIPIENTTNAYETITYNRSKKIAKIDTVTTRNKTIWWIDNSDAGHVTMRSKEYPDWFKAIRRSKYKI